MTLTTTQYGLLSLDAYYNALGYSLNAAGQWSAAANI
jgi:hypothetical protein